MEPITKEQGDKIISLLEQILAKGGVGGGGSNTGGGGANPKFKEGAFTGWKAARVPGWAKFDAGVQLGDLNAKGLAFWLAYEPRPYQGNISPQDLALRRLLDQAKADVDSGAWVPPQYTNKPKEAKAPPKSSPTPPPQGDNNEKDDVPF